MCIVYMCIYMNIKILRMKVFLIQIKGKTAWLSTSRLYFSLSSVYENLERGKTNTHVVVLILDCLVTISSHALDATYSLANCTLEDIKIKHRKTKQNKKKLYTDIPKSI